MSSPAGQLAVSDWKKIGMGALLAVLGALSGYLATVGPAIETKSASGLILAVTVSVLGNMIRKWMTDTRNSLPQGGR
jgi:hypothetical protein